MRWIDVCELDCILPHSGVAALVHGEQIAIFRAGDEVFAISNYDPFSRAYVLARGIVGDRQGVLKVASPIYKHNFDLRTGVCLDDQRIQLPVWEARVVDGVVQIKLP
ncbi:MAG TPA: nitrite reductase small subunit NirD [Oceanobacillus sp.]|nr:nitrite reductase small subunit NirD [Oceanobacillus sp.]